ncbi:MAG: hypothetical protein D3926_24950 [Desulfobacteraceae bacterium]|nr:MAG: hypothetical protein D3926_24950 [Desulfobacteraceae bacterium]
MVFLYPFNNVSTRFHSTAIALKTKGLILFAVLVSIILLTCPAYPEAEGPDLVFVQMPVTHQSMGDRYTGGCRIVRWRAVDQSLTLLTPDFFSALDPSVSFDAKTILFSGKKGPEDHWQIYRMNVDGTSITRLTQGQADHVSPLYVGDLFYLNDQAPTRQMIYLKRSRDNALAPFSLFASKLDGSNPRQVGFNLLSDMAPAVMPNGRLVFSSGLKTTQWIGSRLMAMNIDGTDLMPFTGDQVMSAFQKMPAAGFNRRLYYVETDSEQYLAGGVISSVSQYRSLHSYQTVTHSGQYEFHSPCPTPSALLVSYKERQKGLPYRLGILRTDGSQKGDTSVTPVVSVNGFHCVDAQPVLTRIKARGRSSVVGFKYKDTGALFCMDVYESDREAILSNVPRGSVKQVLIAQSGMAAADESMPKGMTGSEKVQFHHRIIGKAPVETDGSFHVRLPAEIPLTFYLLDKNGMSLGRQNSFSWVMRGENRGCIGCHEDRELSPPNRFIKAVQRPETRLEFSKKTAATFDFTGRITPIVESNCRSCHSNGRNKLSFEDEGETYKALVQTNPSHTGPAWVRPYKPLESNLIRYLYGLDPGGSDTALNRCRMDLTPEQKQILVDWVNLGASYNIPDHTFTSTESK